MLSSETLVDRVLRIARRLVKDERVCAFYDEEFFILVHEDCIPNALILMNPSA